MVRISPIELLGIELNKFELPGPDPDVAWSSRHPRSKLAPLCASASAVQGFEVFRIADCGLRNWGLRNADCGLRKGKDCEAPKIVESGIRNLPNFAFPISNSAIRISHSAILFRIPHFHFRNPQFTILNSL